MERANSPVTKAFRAIALATAVGTAAFGLALGVAGPAAADQPGNDITLLTRTLPAMHPGQTAWVSTLWLGATVDADDFALTATSPDATITYPANTGSFSSMYGSSYLYSRLTDFAALKIRVNDDAKGSVKINLTATYGLGQQNFTGHRNRFHRHRGQQNGWDEVTMQRTITMPVTTVSGASIGVSTTSLGPQAHGTSKWNQVTVAGRKAGVTAFSASVTAPAGITVSYPNAGTSSKLSQDPDLDSDTTDYFAFQTTVDPSVAPGTYNLTVTMRFGNGAQQVATIPLVVT